MKNIISLNINGIRSALKKGFIEWLSKEHPYVLCLQEIRTQIKDLPFDLKSLNGYHTYWFPAQKPGYSGTAIISKDKPLNITMGLNIQKFDIEGRVIIAEFKDLYIVNCYVPNGRADHSRISYKYEFYEKLLEKATDLSRNKDVIICGDFNVAHTEIDLAQPKQNYNKTGFLTEERKCFDEFINNAFIDIHRQFNPQRTGLYTWWNPARDLKERNIGWRYDYFLINKEAIGKVKKSTIHSSIELSDHCPISIEYEN